MKDQKKINHFFMLCMGAAGLFACFQFAIVCIYVDWQDTIPQVINKAGRQRLLSQRAAHWAEQWVDAVNSEDAKNKVDVNIPKNNFKDSIDDLEKSHELLTDPTTPLGEDMLRSQHVKDIFFKAPDKLDQQVKDYIHECLLLLASPPQTLTHQNPHLIYILDKGPGQLLNSLNYVTKVLEQESQSQIQFLKNISIISFLVTLLVLFFLGIFVFRPTLRNMSKAADQMRLLQQIAINANQTIDSRQGLLETINLVCDYMNWPVGHAYIFDIAKNKLISSQIWHARGDRFQNFQEMSEALSFSPGVDLIGKTYETAELRWINDIASEAHCIRRDEAAECGLQQAIAIPVLVEDHVYAVLEFYTDKPQNFDRQFLETLNNIGRQLGQVLERSEAKDRNQLLETVITGSNDAIVITNNYLYKPDPTIVFVNKAFTEMTGYEADELIGKSPRMLQGPGTDRKSLDQLKSNLLAGKPYLGEILNYHKNGQPYWISVAIMPIFNRKGVITHFAAIERDITQQKKAAQEMQDTLQKLKRANLKAEAATRDLSESLKKAEEANKAKSDFLANMSHELRTPMNGVLGMAHLLHETSLAPEQKDYVAAINGSAETLLILLNDILDISKIEAGALTLEHIPYPFWEMVQETTHLMRAQIKSKTVVLEVEFENDVPHYLFGDPARMRQIITNLMSNSIKFTRKGHVRLSVRNAPQANGDTRLHISVEDTGIGIPTSKLESIFEKFTQADTSVTRKYGGTGLGLTITRQLVQLMGGDIQVESVEGKGSTFWLTIPLRPASLNDVEKLKAANAEALQKRAQRKELSSLRTLLVEDYPMNQTFAMKLLHKMGVQQIDLAENGLQAIESHVANPYDVIFMDCQMPELDGYKATERLRAWEESQNLHTPIIAMTANAMMGDREKCLKAGMDEYISKPLRPERLKSILQAWFVFPDEIQQEMSTHMSSISIHTPTPNDAPPVDLAQLREFTSGDLQEEKELFDLFFDQSHELLTLLSECLANENNIEWKATAHRFKGSAGNLGAAHLYHLCKQAEANAEEAVSIKQDILYALQQEMARIQQFAQAYLESV